MLTWLIAISQGGAKTWFEGKHTHSLTDHQFIGEFGMTCGMMIRDPVESVARVVTDQQTTCLVWQRQQLHDLVEAKPELRAAIQVGAVGNQSVVSQSVVVNGQVVSSE